MTPAIDRRRPTTSAPRVACRLAACAAAAAAALSGLLGCDDNGEAHALSLQAKSSAALAAGGAPSEETLRDLQEVAKDQRATPTVITANRSLGQAKLNLAHAKALEAAELQAAAAETLYRLGATATIAQEDATLAAAYLKLDPKAAVAQLQSLATAAQGGPGAATFETVPNATIPTLAAVEQQRSQLAEQVQQQESQLADLTKQRDAKLTAAGEASGRADQQKGEARLAVVKEVAEARKAAADLSRQIGLLQMNLDRSRADLAVQEALKTQLTEAVATFGQQAEDTKKGWTGVSQQANRLNALAKKALQDEGENVVSVKTLAATFADQQKALNDKRADAEAAYKEAVDAFDAAASLAMKLNSSVGGGSGPAFEQGAWDTEKALFNPDRINLDKAEALLASARFRVEGAQLVATQARVAAAIERVGKPLQVAMPAGFDPATLRNETLTKAITDADADFKAAQDAVDGATLSAPDLAGAKPRREAMRVLAAYERSKLGEFAAAAGVAPDVAANIKPQLEAAKAAAAEAQANGTILPRLPEGITPAPATQPAAEGATPAATPAAAEGTAVPAATPAAAPAEGATPAAAPAVAE